MSGNSIEATIIVTPKMIDAAMARAHRERAKAVACFFGNLRRGLRESITGIFGAPAPGCGKLNHA